MSLMNQDGQEFIEEELRVSGSLQGTFRHLQDNKRAIYWWFFKAYLALNLILASLVFWIAIVPSYL